MKDDVDGFGKNAGGRGGDKNAPGGVFRSHCFAEIPAGFGGIFVHRADDFKRMLLAHQTHDGSADGADTELNDTDLLTH